MRFGEYEVLDQVAVGSTGTVYRARHVQSGRVAAVKQLSTGMSQAPGVLDRLRGEAAALSSLDDAHVVALLDVGLDDDPPWLAEQWVDGVTLDRLLQVHGALTAEQAVGVLRGAVQGLAHAHQRGVVHRDVAPGNVLLDASGTSMLVDFGLAAPVGAAGICGTPAFLSPEAAGGGTVGPAGDVYSAGAVLFLLLSGRPPFPGSDVESVLRAHREQEPPPLADQGSLADVVARCLAKDPTARPPDGTALLGELDEAAERRFGAGWLGRASVAGVVAGALAQTGLAGVGGAASGVASGSAAHAAETVVLTTASASTGAAAATTTTTTTPTATAVSTASRAGGRRTLLLAGAAAAALAVGVPAALVLTGGGSDDAAQPATVQVSEERQVAATLSGRYRLDRTVVSTTYDGGTVGETATETWTVTLQCDATTECTGVIGTDSGGQYSLALDGGAVSVTATSRNEGPCINTETGVEDPDSLGAGVTETRLELPDFADLTEVGQQLEGTETARTTYEGLRNCEAVEPDEQVSTVQVTRLS